MGSGGARIRSGPRPDPTSKRSEQRGIAGSLRQLPAEGYTGRIPAWPLPKRPNREVALWKKMWRYPQAVVWAEEPWRWLMIAHYVHWAVKSEQPDASPSTMTQAMRLADAIGLTPAGMRENGWEVRAKTEKEEAESTTSRAGQNVVQIRRRLRE